MKFKPAIVFLELTQCGLRRQRLGARTNMKYARLAIAVLLAVFILVACQNPDQSPVETPAGEWDASTWNQAQWE